MQKRRFTKEFEAEAVRLVRASGRTQREVADDLGIGLSTLVRWVGRSRPGRPPGRKNNRTLQLKEAARVAAASLPETFDGDAHAFLAPVYKDPALPLEIRIMAAGRALRVEKPSLSSVQSRVNVNFDVAERLQAAGFAPLRLERTVAHCLRLGRST